MKALSLGAGVQSSTLLLMACRGEIEKPDLAIFADTGWEDPRTYEHLKFLETEASKAGIPLLRVSAGNVRDDLLNAAEMKSRFHQMPLYMRRDGRLQMGRRHCTEIYKMRPIRRKIRELLDVGPKARLPKDAVELQVGISLDEYQRATPSGIQWQNKTFPLIDKRMSRDDCVAWLSERYPGLVVPRSSCIGCPFHSNECWNELRKFPEVWDDALEADELIRHGRPDGTLYLHRTGQPLADVDLRTPVEKGQLVFPFYQEEERYKLFAKLNIWLPEGEGGE
jgi:hypothetical protein